MAKACALVRAFTEVFRVFPTTRRATYKQVLGWYSQVFDTGLPGAGKFPLLVAGLFAIAMTINKIARRIIHLTAWAHPTPGSYESHQWTLVTL